MDKKYMGWLMADRAKAMAYLILTRRDDLTLDEGSKDETGLDYTVVLHSQQHPKKQPFGVHVGVGMTPVTLEAASKQMKPILATVQGHGPYRFPVCVFFFTMKDNQGYYAWAYEPVVTADGEAKLKAHKRAQCEKLDNDALEGIIVAVKKWYDAFYAALTS